MSIPPQHAHRQLDDTARDGFAEVEIDLQPLQDHRQVEERDGFAQIDSIEKLSCSQRSQVGNSRFF